jgi:hypothetical protein
MSMDEYKIKERVDSIGEALKPRLDQIVASEDGLLEAIASLDAQDLTIARIEDDRSGSGGWVIKFYSKEVEEEPFDENEEDEDD